jgi:FtsP/CotA-like multicopper oxidase with cupredoxin domain
MLLSGLVRKDTREQNQAISWSFTEGGRVKIRLVGKMDSDHPFHIHRADRFLILSRDDEPESNFVWKDTVLLRAGETRHTRGALSSAPRTAG